MALWSKTWALDTLERVISSFAAALLSEWGVTGLAALTSLNLAAVDWRTSLLFAGGTALVTLLKALSASQVGDPNSASLVRGLTARLANRTTPEPVSEPIAVEGTSTVPPVHDTAPGRHELREPGVDA